MNDLGIMICESNRLIPFQEKNFYRRLCTIGEQIGISVFVFSPLRMNWISNQVNGYTFDRKTGQWLTKYFPMPRLIYDRCFFNSREQMMKHLPSISRLRQNKSVYFLGYGLKGKWVVQQALMKEPLFRDYLPRTEPCIHAKSLISWLKHTNEVFLKPQAGSQGRGVLHITRYSKYCYGVKGRDRNNRPIVMMFNRLYSLYLWTQQFINKRKYIIQPYLTLTTISGEAFDIRSLMQKNHQGCWQHTGMAIRRGAPGSITSNLHGGGTAEEAHPYLKNIFGEEKALHICSTIYQLSKRIPPHLEQQFGRLFELGIDFGIDQQGRVWILEVNSKPGRAVFLNLHNKIRKKSSIRNPIHYARYILDQQLGGY